MIKINDFKYDDIINDMNRHLDKILYRYITHDIKLNIEDYNFLSKEHINKEFINSRIKELKNNRKILNKLKKIPYIEQRSLEWFELRKKSLTASDLFDAISKKNKLLAKKKAGVYIENIDFNNIVATKWGTMFEDMAIRCYSQLNNNIKIHEFGLINNKKIENFAASPDGITDLGIMVEIKCPYLREIKKDVIPEKYYYQVQGQLAVCELNECDYIECKFVTFNNYEEYKNYVINNNLNKINHGIIAEYFNKKENKYEYLYSNHNLNYDETLEDINRQKNEKNNDSEFIKLTYWYLEKIYIQRIKFNKELWTTISEKINTFWNLVIECKKLPIEYKIEKKKVYNFIDDIDDE